MAMCFARACMIIRKATSQMNFETRKYELNNIGIYLLLFQTFINKSRQEIIVSVVFITDF